MLGCAVRLALLAGTSSGMAAGTVVALLGGWECQRWLGCLAVRCMGGRPGGYYCMTWLQDFDEFMDC